MSRPAASHVGPATWRILQAVREALAPLAERDGARPLVLVGLSGGPDSLALAAAVAALAPTLEIHAGAVVVDHGLQDGSAQVADCAAAQARDMELDPVIVKRVVVTQHGDGPEAAARDARYVAFDSVVADTAANCLVIAHTLDDVAESVMIGLARGSGSKALAAMPEQRGYLLRPLLNVRRQDTHAACAEIGLIPWHDPQNDDETMLRAVVRHRVMPILRDALSGSIDENLARTATLLRDDVDALDALADEYVAKLAVPTAALSNGEGVAAVVSEGTQHRIETHEPSEAAGSCWTVKVNAVAPLHRAIRSRMYRTLAYRAGGKWATMHQTQEVDRLVTEWHGQGPIAISGATVQRKEGSLRFAPHQSKR